jgi:pimeloyl-ACP methyl ester carboxylesterase
MGGYISQIAAADHSDRVHSITAVDSSPIQLSYYSGLDRWLLSSTPFLLNLYPYSTLINLIAKQIAVSASARSYALETLKTFTKAEISHIMGAVYNGLLQYDQAFLSCPILIVYGDKDKTGKVKSYCDRWAEQENRELKIISNAAHNANMDNPNEFNKVLNEFLATAFVSN